MSDYKNYDDVVKEIEYWLRLATFLHEPLKKALLLVLHNDKCETFYEGLPRDPEELYKYFKARENDIKALCKKSKLVPEQVALLLPNEKKTYSERFDANLVIVVIKRIVKLPIHKSKRIFLKKAQPHSSDQSTSANFFRARKWRNFVHHTDPKDIDEDLFNKKWEEGVRITSNLGLNYDTNTLKTVILDNKSHLTLEAIKTCMLQSLNSSNKYRDILVKLLQDLIRKCRAEELSKDNFFFRNNFCTQISLFY